MRREKKRKREKVTRAGKNRHHRRICCFKADIGIAGVHMHSAGYSSIGSTSTFTTNYTMACSTT